MVFLKAWLSPPNNDFCFSAVFLGGTSFGKASKASSVQASFAAKLLPYCGSQRTSQLASVACTERKNGESCSGVSLHLASHFGSVVG